jgi:hypothetical protein
MMMTGNMFFRMLLSRSGKYRRAGYTTMETEVVKFDVTGCFVIKFIGI